MNQITDQLWITDISGVSESDTSQFDVVISTCQDTREDNVGCLYRHFELADDRQSEERWGGSAEYLDFEQATACILTYLRLGKTILVHCHKGRNRSVAASAAALAVYNDSSFSEELANIQQSREIADPNSLMRDYGKLFVDQYTRY